MSMEADSVAVLAFHPDARLRIVVQMPWVAVTSDSLRDDIGDVSDTHEGAWANAAAILNQIEEHHD